MRVLRSLPASLLLMGMAFGAQAADRFEPIRSYIRETLKEESIPSLSVAVARNGKIIWEEGFGWANLERQVPATEHTMYSLASISKPITATGLMTLVAAGKVDLDAPANDYLGASKLRARVGDAQDATVRRVANHTAGLPLHYQFFYADEPFKRPSMDETLLRYGNLVTAPGEKYEYSNLGYGVLDYLIERVSGQSYADFMRTRVFRPLGMIRTSVDIGPGLEPYAAMRYAPDGTALPFYDFDHPGASAVFSSAHDLVRFGLFHLREKLPDQQQILTDASLVEMHRQTATEQDGSGYGLGFSIWEKDGYRLFGHSGAMGGASTQMRLYPEQRLAIVVLSNASSNLPAKVANRIANVLLPGWTVPPPKTQPQPVPLVAPAALLGTWVGSVSSYTKELPVQLTFQPDGDVHAKLADQLTTLVNNPRFEDGVFTGELTARIGTPDTEHYEYVVALSLTLRDGVLNGGACALGVDLPRERNALTHWIELRREGVVLPGRPGSPTAGSL
ncbi:serine hydrolase domain-containing protein [Steroidobacter sp.]|uniref:serine hydrolase domain-containing protein n=1 Tax=Steroidobacter sp. TaxID=1978227 RepID=UPI0025D60995|nr:serine hydrolase domain-containing protein [Steroidobacter sp.]